MKTTAKEIRARGWEALKRGAWLPMIGGVAVWNVAWTFFAASAVVVLARFFGLADALYDEDYWAVFCKLNVLLLPIMLFVYYFAAVNRFSTCAMGMATMRGGVRFAHAFSGFGKGWTTVWLMCAVHFVVGLLTLCLIVPGVVSALSYSQACFVKVDHPDWPALKCMDESRRLMRASKCRYLRFLLSFLGWFLLAGVSNAVLFGLPFLFVMPYFFAAQAAFYEDLLDKDEGAVLDEAQAATLRRALEAKPPADPADFTDPANPR